jgi:hypothetical protein
VFHNDMLRYSELPVLQDPTIVHFCGPNKPWHRSSASPYVREWLQYSKPSRRALVIEPPVTVRTGAPDYNRSRGHAAGRSRVGRVARAALPDSFKHATIVAATRALYSVESGIDRAREWLQPSPPPAISREPLDDRHARADHPATPASGLDLMISIPRSGTKALGAAIQSSRPDNVHWLAEFYAGLPGA